MVRGTHSRTVVTLLIVLGVGAVACGGPFVTLRVPPASAASPEQGPRDIHPGVLRGLLIEGELTVPMDAPDLTRGALGSESVDALVRVCLDEDGNATATLVREANQAFDAAALAVARRWRFRPYQRNGKTRPVCAVAELSHSFAQIEQRPALPEARVELPPAIEVPVSVRGRFTERPPTPGVAFARVCRNPGTRTAPRFSLLQSSGNPAFDRSIFDEPVTAPARESRSSQEVCWLRAGVSGRRQSFELESVDLDAETVTPEELEMVRLSGAKNIFPADAVKWEIRRARIAKRERIAVMTVPVQVCIDTAGVPVIVRVTRSSGYFSYDMELVNAIAAWRFRPVPKPLCTEIRFIYRQR